MKNRILLYKSISLFALIFFISVFVSGCQATVEKPAEQVTISSDDGKSPSEPALASTEPPEEDTFTELESTPVAQRLPDIALDLDPTVLVGSYSTLDGDHWLVIEWEESDVSWLWLFFGGYDASKEYVSDWSACMNCGEISGNQIHTPVGVPDTSDSTVTEIDMVYIPNMPEHDGEAIYLDDGTEVYTLYRDIDSPRYEDYFTVPDVFSDGQDIPDQLAAPTDGTIAYFRFMTEVGQYIAQNGDYILIDAWTWTNNEIAQYGVSGNPISWHTNRALPPVAIEVVKCVVLPKSFCASEVTYQPCPADVLQMGFDQAEIATYSNMSW